MARLFAILLPHFKVISRNICEIIFFFFSRSLIKEAKDNKCGTPSGSTIGIAILHHLLETFMDEIFLENFIILLTEK